MTNKKRVSQILANVTDYEQLNGTDIKSLKKHNDVCFEKQLSDAEIETKINKHLIELGYSYKNYMWIKQLY